MSSITFKPIIIKGGLRKDNTIPVYIRVYFNGASRRLPTNLVCYPDDLTRSFQIKNKAILEKANDLVKYMRSIISDLNVFALQEMTVDDVVKFIKTHGLKDAKDVTGYQKREEENDAPIVKSIQAITGGMNPCYVYLMYDRTSHLYKIGISSKPYFREKTLQGQQPEISLLFSKQYPTRKIAMIIERVLHETYKDHHTRGEWFRLPQDAVEEIRIILE